jgi:hypothetical protein
MAVGAAATESAAEAEAEAAAEAKAEEEVVANMFSGMAKIGGNGGNIMAWKRVGKRVIIRMDSCDSTD